MVDRGLRRRRGRCDSELLSKAPAFGGLVVNQTWLQLEPEPGTFEFSVLDASLAAVAAYNATDAGVPLGVRLRVFGAYAAPAWAKTLDGAAITTTDGSTNKPATVGRWWGPNTWTLLELSESLENTAVSKHEEA